MAASQSPDGHQSVRKSNRLGLYGAVLQLALALGLGLFASRAGAGELGPPDQASRGIAVSLLFGVPGLIGLLGARAGRPALLAAAAVVDMFGLSLSYAGLLFVAPAGLFIAGAAATARSAAGSAAVARSTILGAVLVGLVVGAAAVLFSTTESRCWAAYSTPTGIVYRYSPFVDGAEIGLAPGAIGEGCETGGVLTPRGEAGAAVLAIGAIALAGLATRPRRRLVSG